MSLILTLFDH